MDLELGGGGGGGGEVQWVYAYSDCMYAMGVINKMNVDMKKIGLGIDKRK